MRVTCTLGAKFRAIAGALCPLPRPSIKRFETLPSHSMTPWYTLPRPTEGAQGVGVGFGGGCLG